MGCEDFGLLVSESVLELNMLRKKAMKKDILASGLICNCKVKLLQSYLTALGNLEILIGGISQLLISITDLDDLNTKVNKMKKLFESTCSPNMFFKHENIDSINCPKMIVLFDIMQKQLEDILFNEIKEKLLPYLGSINGEKHDVCGDILDIIYDFAETTILHLAGLRINCYNIKDTIYEDDRFKLPEPDLNILHSTQCEIKNKELCAFQSGRQKQECLHIFLHPGLVKIKSWLDTYLDLYTKYHQNPSNIHLILDYKLMDEYIWTKKDTERYKALCKIFHEVYIVNSENIVFEDNVEDCLNMIELSELKECIFA